MREAKEKAKERREKREEKQREKQIMKGSVAVAETAARCGVQLVAAYPITPSTHIPEYLSSIQPRYGFDFVPVEGEHSALSVVVGAAAAGARVFTATSSQGLLYMHEVLHNAAGMRLPIVMVVANRAVSAPLNIWNDWQDSVSQRDTGWMQFYCKNSQEAVDAIPQAFRIAESTRFPVMVCFDGFFLTHETSPLDVPSVEEIRRFLPPPPPLSSRGRSLDVNAPATLGAYAGPAHYQEIKEEQEKEFVEAIPVIEETAREFERAFGRKQHALFEEYACGDGDEGGDAQTLFYSMGSLAETTEVAVDALRARGEQVGLLRLKCFRPLPRERLALALKKIGAEKIVVLEKDFSPGVGGVLASELKTVLWEAGLSPRVFEHVCGLGGRDVGVSDVNAFYEQAKKS